MAPRPHADSLYDALVALARGEATPASWTLIDRFVRSVLPSDRDADARQATLLAIHRHARAMDATDAAGAGAWVRRIAQRKQIDEARRQKAHRLRALVQDDGEALEVPELVSGVSLAEEQVASLLAEVEASIDEVLASRYATPLARVIPRNQARARLLRTLGLPLDEVEAALGLPAPVTEATLSKWIERGLPVLVEAIEAWGAGGGGRADLAEALRERVEARRSDAGRARPERRRGASVPPRPPRRRRVASLTFVVLARRRALRLAVPGPGRRR